MKRLSGKRSVLIRTCYTGVLIIGLQACVVVETTPEHTRADYAQEYMVGLSRNAVIGCTGSPQRTEIKDKGKTEILVYRLEFIQKDQSTGTQVRDCEAHFTIKEGHVTALNYKGNSGGLVWNRYKFCEPIIRQCVSHLKSGG